MVSERSYYVVTADIIGSRQVKDSARHAEKGLARLNELYRTETVAAFRLYRGDEIQGVLTLETDLPAFIRRFRFLLRPLPLRMGVGCGTITAGLGSEFSWQMDGSAFHYARQALEQIKSSRTPATRLAGPDEKKWRSINAFFGLLDAVQNRWSEKQWRAVEAYERRGTFKAAAQELGISPQNVYKRCHAAGWKAVAGAERYLAAALRGEGDHG